MKKADALPSEAQENNTHELAHSPLIAHAREQVDEQIHRIWMAQSPFELPDRGDIDDALDHLLSVVQEETRHEMTKAFARSDQPQPGSCTAGPRGEASASPMHWQSIETLKPEHFQHVLLWTPDNECVTVGYFDDGRWQRAFSRPDDILAPTYWMPLPSPPETT